MVSGTVAMSAAYGLQRDQAGARLVRRAAVGDDQVAARVDRDRVRCHEAMAAGAVGEAVEGAGARVEAEDGGVVQVADVERAVRVEGHAEAEAAGRRDLLDRPVGDPVDLAALATAPDRAVRGDRDAFGMV